MGDVLDDVDEPLTEELPRADLEQPRERRRLRRVLVGLGVTLVVLLLLVVGGAWYLTNRYAGNLHHLDGVFAGLDKGKRPAEATAGPSGAAPLTFLVVGSDTRADIADGGLPDGRSDVMMIVRFTGDRKGAQVISLPRDSWVSIPGHGTSKLNAAYAWGGPTLLIQTVEQLTGVRIDHYAAIDFQGFVKMTDALGGVDVQVAKTTASAGYTFQAGTDHLGGAAALAYVRQRHGLPGGDFDREKRQQQFLRAMFGKLSSQNVLSDAGSLDSFLRALTGATSVDEDLSSAKLLEMAYQLRAVRPADITFLTAPVKGTGRVGAASVVFLDEARDQQLWSYLRSDSLQDHVQEFSRDALPVTPN